MYVAPFCIITAIGTELTKSVRNTNGKSIVLTDLQAALETVYNLDTSLAVSLVYSGKTLTSNTTAELQTNTLDLDDLAKHDALEHDASLSRKDYSEGDHVHLQPDLLALMLADSPTDFLTVESLARTRVRRETYSDSIGNSGTSLKTTTLAYIEAAVILLALGTEKDANGDPMAPKAAVQRWFAEERLPVGFATPAAIGFPQQIAMVAKLQAAASVIRGS
jgi:hypothetical protein